MAFLASRFRIFSEMVTPLAAAINAMPIIALAPIFNNMFSTTSSIPRRLVVTIVVFFPIFINTSAGLTRIDPIHDGADALATRRASGRSCGKVRVPGALPFFFTGLKLAASLCVIAAVVAEYFGGLQNGLGSRITSAAAATAYGRAWAYVRRLVPARPGLLPGRASCSSGWPHRGRLIVEPDRPPTDPQHQPRGGHT